MTEHYAHASRTERGRGAQQTKAARTDAQDVARVDWQQRGRAAEAPREVQRHPAQQQRIAPYVLDTRDQALESRRSGGRAADPPAGAYRQRRAAIANIVALHTA